MCGLLDPFHGSQCPKIAFTASKKHEKLQELLKPFILRRVKEEVLKDLPKKSEVILFHDITELQKKYYKALLMKDSEIFETRYAASNTRLLNILMQLRKCVNHPYLFDGKFRRLFSDLPCTVISHVHVQALNRNHSRLASTW